MRQVCLLGSDPFGLTQGSLNFGSVPQVHFQQLRVLKLGGMGFSGKAEVKASGWPYGVGDDTPFCVDAQELFQRISTLPMLKILAIQTECEEVMDIPVPAFQQVLKKCPQLASLALTGHRVHPNVDYFDGVALLTNLRFLHLHDHPSVEGISTCCPALEAMSFSGERAPASDDAIANLLRNCGRLRRLDLPASYDLCGDFFVAMETGAAPQLRFLSLPNRHSIRKRSLIKKAVSFAKCRRDQCSVYIHCYDDMSDDAHKDFLLVEYDAPADTAVTFEQWRHNIARLNIEKAKKKREEAERDPRRRGRSLAVHYAAVEASADASAIRKIMESTFGHQLTNALSWAAEVEEESSDESDDDPVPEFQGHFNQQLPTQRQSDAHEEEDAEAVIIVSLHAVKDPFAMKNGRLLPKPEKQALVPFIEIRQSATFHDLDQFLRKCLVGGDPWHMSKFEIFESNGASPYPTQAEPQRGLVVVNGSEFYELEDPSLLADEGSESCLTELSALICTHRNQRVVWHFNYVCDPAWYILRINDMKPASTAFIEAGVPIQEKAVSNVPIVPGGEHDGEHDGVHAFDDAFPRLSALVVSDMGDDMAGCFSFGHQRQHVPWAEAQNGGGQLGQLKNPVRADLDASICALERSVAQSGAWTLDLDLPTAELPIGEGGSVATRTRARGQAAARAFSLARTFPKITAFVSLTAAKKQWIEAGYYPGGVTSFVRAVSGRKADIVWQSPFRKDYGGSVHAGLVDLEAGLP
jgi:hypothetical protein